MKRFMLAILAGTALATPSSAGSYIANYSTWQSMPEAQKLGYAMGVFDAMQISWSEDKHSLALVRGHASCASELKLNSANLKELIDLGYQDVSTWGHPPNVVLAHQLDRTCKVQLNRERARLGLPPVPAA